MLSPLPLLVRCSARCEAFVPGCMPTLASKVPPAGRQRSGVRKDGSTESALADLEHATPHWQEEGHHPHDDGSYHQDDSKESVQHVLGDPGGATAALLVGASHDVPSPGCAAPDGLHGTRVPNPTADGLLRPPRLRS